MTKKLLTVLALACMTGASAQTTIGGDISLLPAYEEAGTKHLDAKGKAISNVIDYLHVNAGMNTMRVRLFVEPDKKDPAVCQDLNYVQKLGKRIKDAGLRFMLDFHYSDTWADPEYQNIPATWKTSTSNETLADSMYSYTKRCLEYLSANGATPDYVQIGNEISYGMLWRNASDKCYTTTTQTAKSAPWTRLCRFLNAGAKAVREVTPEAKIVIHTERSGEAEQTKTFYQYLNQNEVDYDIIGLSYYPFWHGYISDLAKTLNTLENAFPTIPVQIVETAYYHRYFPSNAKYKTTSTWADSASGQAKFIKDLIAEIQKHKNANGIIYWCPEEAGNGKNKTVMSAWLNRGFWWEDSQWPVTEAITAFNTYAATDIEAVQHDHLPSAAFDLMGRKVERMSKGIYIVEGKKVLVK